MNQCTLVLLSLIVFVGYVQAIADNEDVKNDSNSIISGLLVANVVLGSIKETTVEQTIMSKQQAYINFLYNAIVYDLNTDYDPCEQTLAFTCNENNKTRLDKEIVEEQFYRVQEIAKKLLSEAPHEQDLRSLSIEKQLYQDCMKIEESQGTIGSQSLVSFAFKNIIKDLPSKSWQDIDEELESMNYGHLFFDISVVQDSNNPDKKYLLLEPPKANEIFNTTSNTLDRLMDALQCSVEQQYFIDFSKYFFSNLQYGLRRDILMDGKSTIKKVSADEGFADMEYPKIWESSSSKLNWSKIFENILTNQGIAMSDISYILVKNEYYFYVLVRNLEYVNDRHMVNIVAIKWIYDNIKYTNWGTWSSIQNVDKSSFCLHETKLFGLSNAILNSLNKDPNLGSLIKAARKITRHIVDLMDVYIWISYNMSTAEKNTLQSYLKDITSIFLNGQANESFIDNFYGDYQVTHDYFVDMLNYQRKVDKRLSALRTISSLPDLSRPRTHEPFSINDLAQPQNRLTLRAYFTSYEIMSLSAAKEFQYGNYGTAMARSIYDLLNENPLYSNNEYKREVDWLFIEGYNPSKRACFTQGELPLKDFYDMISEVYALRTAHEAMLQDYLHDEIPRKSFTFLQTTTYSADAMFILSYLKAHCYWDEKFVNSILLNFKQFSSAFGCNYQYDLPKCNTEFF